jgi:hypothetical protein
VILQLRDLWLKEIAKNGSKGRIDVLSWLSKTTLDIIGLAGIAFFVICLTGLCL